MSDAFDRLKNRSRAVVPARNTSLLQEVNDSTTELSHLLNAEELPAFKDNPLNDQKTELSHSVKTKISQDPQNDAIAENNAMPEVVRRTIRLEQTVDDDLERLCSREKVTRETFLEAAFLLCGDQPDLMSQVLTIAKERYRQRKTAGEKRKFQTMGKKYT